MNIVKNIEQYNDDCVYFCDPIKNTIMNDGNFIRILYSTPLFTNVPESVKYGTLANVTGLLATSVFVLLSVSVHVPRSFRDRLPRVSTARF